MKERNLPEAVRELKFHPSRKWRFDFAWPSIMLFVEIEGGFGKFSKSRHASKEGFEKDQIKYNEATLMGWRKLAFTGGQVNRGEAVAVIERFFNAIQRP